MNKLIPRTIEGSVVGQRVDDGYVNATAMCKVAGRLFGHYKENKQTGEYLQELSMSIGIPIDRLVLTIMSGPNEMRGTWVHPHVAVHLAQWLSPRFAVQVSQWVYEWMTGGGQKKTELPFHLRRYMANYNNVPTGHFSVLTEITLTLIAPMEVMGYTLPERLWPDISEGLMFASWLRLKYGIETSDLPMYKHVFDDGRRPVMARAYPERLLGDFRWHMREFWMPKRSIAYFKERDATAIPYLTRLLPPPEKKAG